MEEYSGFLTGIYGLQIPFTIENTGTIDLEIYDISISNSNGNNFILYNDAPTLIPQMKHFYFQ